MTKLMIEVALYLAVAAAVGFMTAWMASRARWHRREAELASRWWEMWNELDAGTEPPDLVAQDPVAPEPAPPPELGFDPPIEPWAEAAPDDVRDPAPEVETPPAPDRASTTAKLAVPKTTPEDPFDPPSRRDRIAAVLKTPEYSYPLELVVDELRHQDQLQALGLRSTLDLLRKCGDAAAVSAVGASTGIDRGALQSWASLADLLRLEHVRPHEAKLLLDAGIDSSQALAAEDAERVATRMAEARAETGGSTPASTTVATWIVNARALPPRLTG